MTHVMSCTCITLVFGKTRRVGVQVLLDTFGNDTCWADHEADIYSGECRERKSKAHHNVTG